MATMTILDQMNRKRHDLHRLERDMRGISPKLALYTELGKKADAIRRELEVLGAKRAQT